jgi:hypothetical protein
MRYPAILLILFLVAGCAGSGNSGPGGDESFITPSTVQIVSVAPQGAERIGTVRVMGGDMNDPGERNSMLRRLKQRAAQQGANVIVLDGVASSNEGVTVSSGIGVEAFAPTGGERSRLSGTAYYLER